MLDAKCQVCGRTYSTFTLQKDLATGFYFCKDCSERIQMEYESLIGKVGLSTWLRAIANVMDRKGG